MDLITMAIKKGKKIAVYGDYDVDGVMSTTILSRTIERCGGEVTYYVPHRQQEGYGLNNKAVEQLAAEGVGVLFTCDNGIAAMGEVALAKELGMEVVILDHHEPAFTEGKEGAWRDILPSGTLLSTQNDGIARILFLFYVLLEFLINSPCCCWDGLATAATLWKRNCFALQQWQRSAIL